MANGNPPPNPQALQWMREMQRARQTLRSQKIQSATRVGREEGTLTKFAGSLQVGANTAIAALRGLQAHEDSQEDVDAQKESQESAGQEEESEEEEDEGAAEEGEEKENIVSAAQQRTASVAEEYDSRREEQKEVEDDLASGNAALIPITLILALAMDLADPFIDALSIATFGVPFLLKTLIKIPLFILLFFLTGFAFVRQRAYVTKKARSIGLQVAGSAANKQLARFNGRLFAKFCARTGLDLLPFLSFLPITTIGILWGILDNNRAIQQLQERAQELIYEVRNFQRLFQRSKSEESAVAA